MMSAHRKTDWHERWLALNDQHDRHLETWCAMSSKLERQPGWFALTEDEKAAAERASGLTELDGLVRILHRRLVRSLRKIPKIPSRDYDAVLANLQVAERLMPPEENAVVHGILWRAVRDLIALRDPS